MKRQITHTGQNYLISTHTHTIHTSDKKDFNLEYIFKILEINKINNPKNEQTI